MSDKKILNKYRIPSTRAVWHGYDDGAYFVTICTQNKKHYFGKIVDGTPSKCDPQMQLSPIGQYAYEQFVHVSEHYPYAEIPLFVIMPNHIHAIVWVNGKKIPYPRRIMPDIGNCDSTTTIDTVCNDMTMDKRDISNVQQADGCIDVEQHCVTSKCDMKQIAYMQGWLSVVIGGLKRSITHYARTNKIPFTWQTRFHDRIIRNQQELNRIATYIEQNIAQWCINNP